MITNVDDIETHINSVEQARPSLFSKQLTFGVCVLRRRGTWLLFDHGGSLFPGLDGVAKAFVKKFLVIPHRGREVDREARFLAAPSPTAWVILDRKPVCVHMHVRAGSVVLP
jgi:hypothetical protein